MQPTLDNKALKTLINNFRFTDSGRTYPPSPQDFAHAISAGYMFPPTTAVHDETIQHILDLVPTLNFADVANAFLASLSTRRLDLRSALGSYAVARFMPGHTFQPAQPYTSECPVCRGFGIDADPNLLSFQRHKWGGVGYLDPFYIELDLTQFSRLPGVSYTEDDVNIFRTIMNVAGNMSPNDSPQALERALSRVLDSGSYERHVLIELLGCCGILQDPEHPGFATRFVPHLDRTWPTVRPSTWRYPVVWWRGRHGVNGEALALFFPKIYPKEL